MFACLQFNFCHFKLLASNEMSSMALPEKLLRGFILGLALCAMLLLGDLSGANDSLYKCLSLVDSTRTRILTAASS